MTLNEYQEKSKATAIYPAEQALAYVSLGLAAEAGEVANKFKKIIRDDNGKLTPERSKAIADELGDVLWYAAQIATELGVDLDAVAEVNLAKLQSRMDRGQLQGSGDNR
jgi:NTP pyrophosphatase (non-canonical NTP hydrolase)